MSLEQIPAKGEGFRKISRVRGVMAGAGLSVAALIAAPKEASAQVSLAAEPSQLEQLTGDSMPDIGSQSRMRAGKKITDREVHGKSSEAPAIPADGKIREAQEVFGRRASFSGGKGQDLFQKVAAAPFLAVAMPLRLTLGGETREAIFDAKNPASYLRDTADWLSAAGKELKEAKEPVELKLTGDLRSLINFASFGGFEDTVLSDAMRFEIDPKGTRIDFQNNKDFTTVRTHEIRENDVEIRISFSSFGELLNAFSKKR